MPRKKKKTLLRRHRHEINCTHSEYTVQWALTNAQALITATSTQTQTGSFRNSSSGLFEQFHFWPQAYVITDKHGIFQNLIGLWGLAPPL